MKAFIYILSLLIVIQACKKKSSTPVPDYDPNETFCFTVIDRITQQPVDSARVLFEYGNNFGMEKHTGTDGKVSFSIPKGWIVNEVFITKPKYCYYIDNPSAANQVVPLNKTIYLDHYAYLRFHVKNVFPTAGSDKVEIGYIRPLFGSMYSYPDVFYGAIDTTYITASYAAYYSFSYSVFSGTTFVNSNSPSVNAIGGDTTDVAINF